MRRDYSSLRQGLLGAWCPSLGATGYTLLDRSGRGNNGVLVNMDSQANWQTSGTGVGLVLDGTNDYVSLGGLVGVLPSTTTLSAWVRPTRVNSTFGFFVSSDNTNSGQSGIGCAINNANYLYVFYRNSFRSSSAVAQANTWYHLCMTCVDGVGNIPSFFLNGALQAGSSGAIASGTAGGQLALGRRPAVNPSYGACIIDDVRVYNRALTQQEIRLLASRRGIGLTPGRQRRTSASSRRLYANVSGAWKETLPMVNVGGTWKEGAVYENVGGTWKN